MISKAQVKHIRSLDDKKMRYENKQFIVEGTKLVHELLKSNFRIVIIYGTKDWEDVNRSLIPSEVEFIEVNSTELKRISNFTTPNEVLAIVEMPNHLELPYNGVTLALDNIQDPGNFGTMIRIADWYGIESVVCNTNTVDFYNHKVLQASMGSVFNVRCFYTNLMTFFLENKNRNKFACVLHGNPVHSYSKIQDGIIVIGNESNGISAELLKLCTHKVTIPRRGKAESLNAAVAAGIVCNALL